MNAMIAVAQTDSVLGNVEKNVEMHCAYAERALQAGADMVVFPELSLTGYTIRDMNWDLAMRPADPPAVYRPLVEMSEKIPVLAGGIEEGERFGIYNSALLFEGGTVRSVHRKIYPPTYGMFEEMRYFSQGDSVRAVDTKIGRIGVLVCEDLWHLSLPYLLAMDGATAIISLTASPTRLGGDTETLRAKQVNEENHKAYARLLSVYLVFCNRVGFEDGVNFWGGSAVVGTSGEPVASGKLFEPDLLLARLDENNVRRSRRFSRHLLDEDPRMVQRELSRILNRSNE